MSGLVSHLMFLGTRQVVVTYYGERHCPWTRQNKRAAAPDTWGEAKGTALVQPGENEQGVEWGAWSCCLHHLLAVLERMKPDSPETVKGHCQRVTGRNHKLQERKSPGSLGEDKGQAWETCTRDSELFLQLCQCLEGSRTRPRAC